MPHIFIYLVLWFCPAGICGCGWIFVLRLTGLICHPQMMRVAAAAVNFLLRKRFADLVPKRADAAEIFSDGFGFCSVRSMFQQDVYLPV